MESNEQTNQQEMVMVTLELPRDLVDWIDGLKAQMGFRNRGVIVARLIRELLPSPDDLAQERDVSDTA
jgi:metal-responsive CopG/Arc/MetJ family transcriptional regulator